MMSMIVAQISSGTGLVSSVGGEETMNWGRLTLSSVDELTTLSKLRPLKKSADPNRSSSEQQVKLEPSVDVE
jgi:hypothetical protein